MSKYFDIEEVKAKQNENSSSGHYISKYLLSHYEKIKNLDKDLQRLPSIDEFFFLQSDTQFNAFTFIPFVAKSGNIKYLHATTYTINREVVDALIQLHDTGLIENIELLISDSLKTRNPSIINYLEMMLTSRPNFIVKFTWVHAKVSLLHSQEGYYVIEGSGNWAANAQYEQYIFTQSKGLYEFRMKLFTESKLK